MEFGELKEPVKEQYFAPVGVSGLGGWLVLVQIGLYSTIILLLVGLVEYSPLVLDTETWEILTSKGSEYYHALWRPAIIFEIVYNLLFLLFCVYILFQLYQKKAVLPRLMIIFYSVSLVVGIVEFALLSQIPLAREMEDGSSLKDIIRSFLTCAIWIPYFIKSERVRNTFVRY